MELVRNINKGMAVTHTQGLFFVSVDLNEAVKMKAVKTEAVIISLSSSRTIN